MEDLAKVLTTGVTIYKHRLEDESLQELLAYFDNDGNLVLSGWDLGGQANEALGRDEHEYWVVVAKQYVPLALLALLREHYSPISAVSSDFMRLLGENGARYGFSTWTREKATEGFLKFPESQAGE